jgi:hypothetical protein
MKKILPILLFFTFSVSAFSQIRFEKGYIIDNNGTRTECLIENKDWAYNPETFQYKFTENASPREGTLATIKEFGVYGYSRYIRARVELDSSKSYPISELSSVWSPEWKQNTLFLKILVEGKASLYAYEAVKMKKFFYATAADSTIRQLIYKQYTVARSQIKDNISFRQQLINEVRCQMPADAYFERINYDVVSLRKHFEKYNQCMGSQPSDYTESVKKPKKYRGYLNFRITPGLSYSALDINFSAGSLVQYVKFDKSLFPRAGMEMEYIMAFNKNKWSFFMEPTYQTYKKTRTYTTSYNMSYQYAVDYQSIELPIGARYYFFLKDESRLFVNVIFLPAAIRYFGNPRISYGTVATSDATKLDVKSGYAVAMGGGYSFGNFSLEMRYYADQNLLTEYRFNSTDYQRLTLLVGYRFLNLKRSTGY